MVAVGVAVAVVVGVAVGVVKQSEFNEGNREVKEENQSNEREPNEEYNLNHICEKEIRPLVDKIYDICEKHKMPFIAAVAHSNESTGDAEGSFAIRVSALNFPEQRRGCTEISGAIAAIDGDYGATAGFLAVLLDRQKGE